jgi:hypothetical protein
VAPRGTKSTHCFCRPPWFLRVTDGVFGDAFALEQEKGDRVFAAAMSEAASCKREAHEVLEVLLVGGEVDAVLVAALSSLHCHAAELLPLVEGERCGVLHLDANGGVLGAREGKAQHDVSVCPPKQLQHTSAWKKIQKSELAWAGIPF